MLFFCLNFFAMYDVSQPFYFSPNEMDSTWTFAHTVQDTVLSCHIMSICRQHHISNTLMVFTVDCLLVYSTSYKIQNVSSNLHLVFYFCWLIRRYYDKCSFYVFIFLSCKCYLYYWWFDHLLLGLWLSPVALYYVNVETKYTGVYFHEFEFLVLILLDLIKDFCSLYFVCTIYRVFSKDAAVIDFSKDILCFYDFW